MSRGEEGSAIADWLEIGMLICFGASWPINFLKGLRAKTSRGVSVQFFCLIELGYACGALAKCLSGQVNFVLLFYLLNMLTVAANIALYFVNRRHDRRSGAGA